MYNYNEKQNPIIKGGILAIKCWLLTMTIILIGMFTMVVDSLSATMIALNVIAIVVLLGLCYIVISEGDLKTLLGAKLYKEFEDEL